MSNNFTLEENLLLQFFSSLNTHLIESDFEKVFALLNGEFLHNPRKHFNSLVQKGILKNDGSISQKNHIRFLIGAVEDENISEIRKLVSVLNPPMGLWSSLPQIEKERDIKLAIFDKDMNQVKTWIKLYRKQHSLKPDSLIRKLFGRFISEDLLNSLPVPISLILIRSEAKDQLFNTQKLNVVFDWALENKNVPAEDKVTLNFIHGDTVNGETTAAKAFGCWSSKDFEGVCKCLDKIEQLVNRNKIVPGKFNQLLAMIHILSRMQIANNVSVQTLYKTYYSFLGDSMVFRTLDILLDLNKGSIKLANKKLASLQFHHKGEKGDTFFLLLARFWCENQLSVKDLETLKSLKVSYSKSKNKFMIHEVDALYREVLGADGLLESHEKYTHLTLARYLKGENKWDELLETLQAEKSVEKRLIWLVHLEPGSEKREGWAEIEPAIQKKGKKNWLDPKIISWLELMKPSNRELLASRDRRIVSILRNASETHGVDYVLPEGDALKILAGAENLFYLDDYKQQITVECIKPAVEVIEESGKKYFSWKFPLSHGALHVEEIEDFVYEVCPISKELLKLKEKTLKKIPIDDEEAFKKFLEALPEDLEVHSDEISEDQIEGSKVNYSCRIVARFYPAGQEYRIQFLSSCGPMTSIPGQGRTVMSYKESGQIEIWQRDKHNEGLLADDICSKAGLDHNESLSHYEWDLTDKEQLLNVLDFLSDHPQVDLQWPRGGRLKVSKSVSGSFSVKPAKKKDWFQLDGKIYFDKQSIRLADVMKKVEGDSRFVKLSDNEYIALSQELRQGLLDMERLSEIKHEALELHAALADTVSQKLKDVPGDLEEDFIFKDCVTRMIYAKTQKIEVPQKLNAKLRTYQKRGFEWLASLTAKGVGACLADDMGLGKTLQSLALLLHKKEEGPSLIIAPTSLCQNWIHEGMKFTPSLNLIDYRGKDRDQLIKNIGPGDVIVSSYAIVNQDIDLLMDIYLNVLVLDEAQMVKNSGTLRSKSIKLIQARSKVALSGTPIENHAGELWNLFDIINPGLLGTRAHFQKAYALPIEQFNQEAISSLKEKVKPFILRRIRKKVLNELPDSQESSILVPMTETEASLYNAGRYNASKKLKKAYSKNHKKDRIQILAEITNLRKLAANFEMSEMFKEKSSKSKAVLSKIEELLENGHKALIFSQFVTHLNIFEEYFKEKSFSYTRLDGSMKQEHRKQAVDLFNSGQRDLMLISLKAGGFGLNLTAADFVIHLDPWWNPAVEDQAAARAVRIGQTKKVNILRFITENSIESEIIKMHDHKRDISDDLLRGTSVASKMSVDDLLKLINN